MAGEVLFYELPFCGREADEMHFISCGLRWETLLMDICWMVLFLTMDIKHEWIKDYCYVKLWTFTETIFYRAQFGSSYYEEQFFIEQAGAVSKQFLALLFIERPFCSFVLAAFFLYTREWSCCDIQCFVFFFQKRLLTLPAESLAVVGNCCFRKHADRWTRYFFLERINRRPFAV